MVCGVWSVCVVCVCGVWCVVCGVWCVVCGVWCVVCGVWCVVCGVWCAYILVSVHVVCVCVIEKKSEAQVHASVCTSVATSVLYMWTCVHACAPCSTCASVCVTGYDFIVSPQHANASKVRTHPEGHVPLSPPSGLL